MTKTKSNIIEESNIFEQIRTLFGLEEDCGFTDEEMQPFFKVIEKCLHCYTTITLLWENIKL